MIVDKGSVDYFDFGSWLGFPYNSFDDDYEEEDYYSRENLEKTVRDFSAIVTIYDGYEEAYSGIWNGDDYDLTIAMDLDGLVTIQAYGTYEDWLFKIYQHLCQHEGPDPRC
ncbi:hypothetical protein [Streptococcus sp.]|uniref:hypothetical protein n=1 Tax=Streptococcus sp. TaxID=1306 RepID=UPI00391CD47B